MYPVILRNVTKARSASIDTSDSRRRSDTSSIPAIPEVPEGSNDDSYIFPIPGQLKSPRTPRTQIKRGIRGVPKSPSIRELLKSPSTRVLTGIDTVSKKTKRGLSKVTENVGTVVNRTEDVYENSRWCWLPRFFVRHFPRVFSFTFGVVVPLWFLIAISAGFGTLLASYEAPHEQVANHAILQSRARLNRTFVNRTDLVQLPVRCFSQYLSQTDRSPFEQRINDYFLIPSSLEENNNTTTNITDATNMTNVLTNTTAGANATTSISGGVVDYTVGDVLEEIEQDIYLFMSQCQQVQHAETQAYYEVRDGGDGNSAGDSLTFNWNRCWRKEINDEWGDTSAVYFPPDYLVEASRPAQQEAAVETEFARVLYEAEKECVDSGGEEEECFEQALHEASYAAGNLCHDNLEATAWFFFTVMTTVGYGNQTPVTDEGRMLIYIAGIASLILFAAVLGSAGYIITTIFDDFVARLPFAKHIQHPLVGVFLWGAIWIGWAYAIAYGADSWWQRRLPDYDVDVEDTMWFAFISTATIGLGDYFLQPEVMFASDALGFSITFLVGFVLLSTFLSKLGEFLFNMLPERQESLESRLKGTNLIFWNHWPCNDYLRAKLRSYLYFYETKEVCEEEPRETEDDNSSEQEAHHHDAQHHHEVQHPEMQRQIERVKIFKSQLPNRSLPPPLNTMYLGGEKSMVNLIDEEEIILKALLEALEIRRTELNRASEESDPTEEREISLLAEMGPLPLDASGSLRDDADSMISA